MLGKHKRQEKKIKENECQLSKKVISGGSLLRSRSSTKDTSADQNSAQGGREKQK